MVVNGEAVRLGQFTEKYESFLMTTSIPDNLRSRHIFTDALIDEVLFLAWADSTGLLNSARHQQELRAIDEQLLLNRLYQEQIRDKITISDQLFRETYRWSKSDLHTRHLFAKDRQTAENLYQRLLVGEKWEDLAREAFRDPVLAGNGGDLGFRRLGDLDPAYEVAAYQLADGEISPPVMTRTGYSIIQVLEREYDPFLIEEEFQVQKAKLRRIIMSYLKRPSVRAYTDSVLASLNIQFHPEELGRLIDQLDLLTTAADDYQVKSLNALVVEFGEPRESWTIGQALDRLRYLSPGYQQQIDAEENLKRAIAGLIVQDRLLAEARAHNYESEPEFQQASQQAKKSYTIVQVLKYIIDHARLSEDELRNYYDLNSAELASEPKYEIMELVLADPDTAALIHQLLQGGYRFEELAQRYSLRKETAERGGYLGWGTIDQFGGLKSVLREAEIGALLGPINLGGMDIIVKVLDIQPSAALTLEEARPIIEHRLATQTRRQAYESFRHQLREKAAIRIDSTGIREFAIVGEST
ncbi:MAG: peptidylprolyl isomerase [Candidatus Neomarinimicrobiota bacterium]